MGRRGYVQKRQAEHEMSVCLSDWGQSAAAEFLENEGLNLCTGDSSGMASSENSARWEIELPWTGKGKRAHIDWRKMEKIVRDLRKKPSLVTADDGTEYGENLAALLEEGLKAAKKHNYSWIIVDFW